ncbi:MAG: zf-HC2 domain-containing protein [Oscillospiraceae bacterium]|nr:zf-HC2 domain-containing protein [Oscillospiraceae bacterium]
MKYEHEVIRDLMPLCIDGIASLQSEQAVQAHIKECPDCAKEWAQMNTGALVQEAEPLPESTEKYQETAARVRKKTRWRLLKSVLLTLACILVIVILGNLYIGNRFSTRTLAKRFAREDWDSLQDSILAVEPDISSTCSFSDLELRILGEMITPDRKTKSTFLIADVPDTNITAFWESIAERGNPLQLGMWEDGGGSAGHFPAEKTIRMTEGSLHFDNGGSIMDYFIFYVTDEAVKKITVEAFGQSHTIIPDENGFGYISNTELMSDRLRQKKPPEEICTGEAFDANGKLLHRIEAPGFRLQDGTLLTYYGWVPVTE